MNRILLNWKNLVDVGTTKYLVIIFGKIENLDVDSVRYSRILMVKELELVECVFLDDQTFLLESFI